jgi:hypothetical protein
VEEDRSPQGRDRVAVLGGGGWVVAGRRPGHRQDVALCGGGHVTIRTSCRVEEVTSLPGGGCITIGNGGWVAIGTSRRVGEASSLMVEDVASLPGAAHERTWRRHGGQGQPVVEFFFLLGMERGSRVQCGGKSEQHGVRCGAALAGPTCQRVPASEGG